MIEQWKEIVKPDGNPYSSSRVKRYLVSNLGRVKSVNLADKDRLLKMQKDGFGYLRVALYDNDKQYKRRVHRLVLGAFVGNCPEGKEVDHINRVKSDNRLKNLRYVTSKENQANRGKYECKGGLPRRAVLCVETGERCKSLHEMARKLNLSASGISDSCRNGWACHNLHFEFL